MKTKYPNLLREDIISLDIETKDPNVCDKGPGVYRKDGYTLGVSIATPQGFSEYYNLGHPDCSNEEQAKNLKYLRDVLGQNSTKVGHSLMYDVDWLENGEHKIQVNGPLINIEFAEALLDETQTHYNLDYVSRKYLNKGKLKTKIDAYCTQNNLKGDSRQWLWQMPYELIRDYAKEDAVLPLEIFNKQKPQLIEQELYTLFEMENLLVRPLLLFRKTGIAIDKEIRDRNIEILEKKIAEQEGLLFDTYGPINVNSTQQLAKLFASKGFAIPRTAKGSPSIDKYFFKKYEDEDDTVKLISEIKKNKNVANNFLSGIQVDCLTDDGLLHPQFFNLRSDSFGALRGTRSGRLSCANPNIQQQPSPSRDSVRGTLCRESYKAFDDCWWGKIDYNQIEYRFMAHFATGAGSIELREAYNKNPETDYHQFIMNLTGLNRSQAKNLNYGVAFGMGVATMSEYFGWTHEYAKDILALYHKSAPYVRATTTIVERVARQRGYIKTFLGRRSRLIDESKAYTMYCRLVQGSAADLMKSAIVKAYKDGIFNILFPHMTIHDELDFSVPKTNIGVEAFKELKNIMESVLSIRVPILTNAEIGHNWAKTEKFDWKDLL